MAFDAGETGTGKEKASRALKRRSCSHSWRQHAVWETSSVSGPSALRVQNDIISSVLLYEG
ncbi:hypothetical protein EYF80_064270 [Liparis tanakae]|uniref:Uncharacterized protein n=1 Tax=Liparis tanakae TaxID=230148 RepID=A0A4Z2E9W2_9TELE|nr:hypothetical protein EYF80_064270 [Liparis tanakae]